MNLQKLEAVLIAQGQPRFRLEQVKKAIYRDGVSSWSQITTLSKSLRDILTREIVLLSFEVRQILVSKDGQSIKALLELADGNLMETVLIAPKPGMWSACISSQVGCAIGCRFCATGKMGFKRNLTSEEITDQVLFWIQYLKNKNQELSTIVYMGMGEPFLNWKQVSQSLRDLIDPVLFGLGARSISVSTSGIPEGIESLAVEFPQVNLALSLHFATNEKRSAVMPINQKNSLEKLRFSLQSYFTKTKRKIFLEYVMLAGLNDSNEDADKLVRFVKSIGKLQLLHVNLIRYNVTDSEFKSSSKERTAMFRKYLEKNRISVTIRKSLGEEIRGACGQLAGK